MYDIIEAIKNKTSYRIRFMHIIMGLLFIMLIVKLYSLQITSGDIIVKKLVVLLFVMLLYQHLEV